MREKECEKKMETNSEMKAKVLALNARSGSVMKIKEVFF